MNLDQIVEKIRNYISQEILEGDDDGLDGTTPLLELGILNSMEVARLVVFLQDTFTIDVPNHKIVAENLQNIDAIAQLVQTS